MWTNCAWEFCLTTWSWWRSLGFETINVAETNTSWEHCSSVWFLFFIHDPSFQRLICSQKLNVRVLFLFTIPCSTATQIPLAHPVNLTCHHLKVSSERALFSLVIRGWMDWLKCSANQGSSSSSVMHCRQAHGPLEKKLSDKRKAYLKK